MAQTTLIPKPYSQREFVENTKKSQKILLNTQTSIVNINNVLKERKEKREKIHSSIIEGKKRREFLSRRQEIEEELESKKIVSAPNISGIINLASRSGKSFIDRIVGSLGYLAAGWVLRNLPTWTAMAQEFIARLQEAGKIIRSFVTGTINIFQSSFRLITSAAENLKNFDLFDSSNKVKDSFGELIQSITDMGGELEAGIKLITTPLTQTTEDGTQVGSYSGQEVPALGSTSEDMGAYGSQVSSANVSDTQKQALSILAKYESESSGGYNAVNQVGTTSGRGVLGYSGDFTKMKQHGGRALTDMTIAEIMDLQAPRPGMSNAEWIAQGRLHAVGRYQFIGNTLPGVVKRAGIPTSAKFTPEVQDLLALQLMKERGIQPWVGPSDKASPAERAIIEKARKESISFKTSTSQGQQSQAQTSTSAQASSPQRAISAGTMKLIPQTGDGGFIQGGSGNKGEAQYATHFHIDALTANPTAEQLANIREVSFQATKAMLARGSTVWFGNLNQYASSNDSTLRNQIAAEQRAHARRSSAAVDMQEVNSKVPRTFPSQPGSATKFPFAVGEVRFRGGYGRESEIIGSRGITVSHGASGSSSSKVSSSSISSTPQTPPPAQTTPPKAQISQTPTQQKQQQIAQQITPERKAQDIVAIIPDQQTQPSSQMGSQPMMPIIKSGPSMTTVLNNFMKQKLLLELAYV
jgi:hypothetical protein